MPGTPFLHILASKAGPPLQTTPITKTLADYTAALRVDALPEAVLDKLKLCIRDALECCLSPMRDQRSDAAFSSISRSPALPCTLFGTAEHASAADAAFYNTVKGALTSRNDSSRTAICHPGSILIPVTFAIAQQTGASGAAVLEALLAGYETMIRLGSALVAANINGSWRNTSLVAPFGAAFAAAKLLGLDARQIASAASFSCHFAGGVNEWAVAGTGEDVFQNGWGAHNGIFAAQLAAAGAVGCDSILEGKSGLLSALDALDTQKLLTEGLPDTFRILEVIHKPINSCFMVQGPAQTAQRLLQEAGTPIAPAQIKSVEIDVAGQAKNCPGCDNNRSIGSLVQGIMSIQLGVASTLVRGSCDGINWAPPIDEAILQLMRRCHLREDPQMTAAFPQLQGARIRVQLQDGRCFAAHQPDALPLTPAKVHARFLSTAANSLFRAGKSKPPAKPEA